MKQVEGVPCEECGYDGPHPVHRDEAVDQYVAECGSCHAEFGVPPEAVTG
jgi:hypothetical protein